jgi:GntR family transcriptional regulator
MAPNSSIFSFQMPAGETLDSTTLVQRVAEQMRRLIMDGKLQPEAQLPNETDLSEQLNVSRSTVRSALIILEQAGFVQRRWGVGTFIAKDPPTYNNLSINSGVTQLIRSSGAEPGCAETLITVRPASERVANRLSIDPGSEVVVLERVRLANERRIVFALDYLPRKLFLTQEGEVSTPEIEQFLANNQSMYRFMKQRLGIDIHHGIAWIQPLTAENYLAEKLQVPGGSNLLHIEQIDFGNDGDPLALSDEYYVADAFKFYIYRSS